MRTVEQFTWPSWSKGLLPDQLQQIWKIFQSNYFKNTLKGLLRILFPRPITLTNG